MSNRTIDSVNIVAICAIAICILMIVVTITYTLSPNNEQPQLSNPIPKPHTPTFVSDSVHQQNMQLMNEWKTRPPTYIEYDSFMDIPAGQTDTIIMVAGEIYEMGDYAWLPNTIKRK